MRLIIEAFARLQVTRAMARARTRPASLTKRLLSLALLFGAGQAAAAAPERTAPTPEELRGPDVVIIAGEQRTIYEYRQNGHLRMVKIVPNWGKPYYLLPRDPTAGFGDLERADALLPTWVIVEF